MVIVIVLIGAAEREQVVAMQRGNVVLDHFVLTIPEPLPDALRIHVIRNQRAGALAADFERATRPRKLRRAVLIGPLPEGAEIVENERIGGGWIHDGSETCGPDRGLLRTRRKGLGRA